MEIPTDIMHTYDDSIDIYFEFSEDDLEGNELEFIVSMAVDESIQQIREKAKEIIEDFKEELKDDPELRKEFGIEDDEDG